MKNQRPLSPHLQIYRPQLTSILSILHRVTGVVVALGALVIALWFWFLVSNLHYFIALNDFLTSILGSIFLVVWTLSTTYHLLNGIRHLFWDVGYGLSLQRTYLSGRIVVIATFVLTLTIWLV